MPILGNLSEFPLPEVFLLIGTRTGRLRLLDVPQFGIMDVDFSNGEVQSMRLGSQTFTEPNEMISRLSEVVQSHGGMFEFKLLPVASVAREHPLMVNQLVMSLVCFIDHEVAHRRKEGSPDDIYVLESNQPDIWIEPELNEFFLGARQYLTMGVRVLDLAEHTQLDAREVHQNLTNLRLLGLVKVMNPSDTTLIKEAQVHDQIARKSNDFLRAVRAVSQIQKATSSMPKMTQM